MDTPTASEKRRKVAEEFAKASEELLTSEAFFDSIKIYSGSISPHVAQEVDSWKDSGAIPPESVSGIYTPGNIVDLSGIGAIMTDKPELRAKFDGIYEENKEEISPEDLYARFPDYQDALMRLASSSEIFRDSFSDIPEVNESWIEMVKINLDWMKKMVTMSIGTIYQGFGKLYDKVTKTIDDIVDTLSRWNTSLKKELVEKIRTLSQYFLELLNNIISTLFGWLSRLREIA